MHIENYMAHKYLKLRLVHIPNNMVHLVHIPNYMAQLVLIENYMAHGAHGANYMARISLFWKFPRIFATVLWLNRKYDLAPWEIQLMHRIRQITLIAVQQCISVQSTVELDQINPGLLTFDIQAWNICKRVVVGTVDVSAEPKVRDFHCEILPHLVLQNTYNIRLRIFLIISEMFQLRKICIKVYKYTKVFLAAKSLCT